MGYTGKLDLKEKAQQLRRQGKSYGEILTEVSVSKDTLSRWCKDIILTESQKQQLLHNKSYGQKKGSLVAAENKRQARIERAKLIKSLAAKDIRKLSERDQFIMGVMLYAAEGDKMDGKGGFTNADPLLIKFMCSWLKKFAKLPIKRLRGAIWLHEGLNETNAKAFWSRISGIPLSQFRKTYFVQNKIDSKKIRKNIHAYGVFAIRFSDSAVHRKIMGWIYACFDDRMSEQINNPL